MKLKTNSLERHRMQTIEENAIVNRKLAQFKQLLRNDMIKKENNVKWILEKMGDINQKVIANNYLETNRAEWIGYTALHFALDKNQEAFDILLDYGADFTVKNSNSLTVLHRIIISLNEIILKYKNELSDPLVNLVLSAHLKNENFQNPVDNSGISHFHIACAANNLEVVRGFINSGVFINDTVKTDSTYFAGFSPLHFAAKFCAFEVTDLLLFHGANLNLKDAKGLRPLHVALETKIVITNNTYYCSEKVRDKNEQILQLLLNKETNDNTVMTDYLGLSNFHINCALKDSKIAEDFLQNRENINNIISKDSPSWPGYTPLHFAALCNMDTVKLLVKRGADMNVKNAKGITPFDLCIERYKLQDIYAILSLNPVWKNITLSDGKTTLSELVFAMRYPKRFALFLKKLSNNFSICDSPLWPGCTPMHLAVIFTKANVLESLAVNLDILNILWKQCPAMLQHQDIHGHTPVHLAFRSHKKSLLILLMSFLQKCTNLVDRVDEDGLSLVHIASATDQIILLQRLLATGSSDVNAVYRGKSEFSPTIYPGSTALHFAVANESADAISALINSGADVYAKDTNGMTPIHLLLSCNSTKETADILLSLPNLQDAVLSSTGLSHLHVACWFDLKGKNVEKLLENGADINGLITVQASANDESNKLKFVEKFAGRSPLLIASQRHNRIIIDLLVEHGADCFVKDADGIPWLYGLADSIFSFHWDWFVKALQERDDLMTRLKADTEMTTFHMACLLGNIGEVKKSLIEGTDVNKQIRNESPIFRGYTALHILIRNKALNEELLRLFLKSNYDVTLQSSESETAIYMAYDVFIEKRGNDLREEYFTYVNIMLEAQQDFNVNPTSIGGTSHFHIACSVCNVNVVEKFLKSGHVDIDQPIDYFHDKEPGHSALHLVAESEVNFSEASKQLRTLDLLLRHGADVHAEDNFGDTPLHDSARWNALDVFERLVRNGSDVNVRNINGYTPLHNYSKSDKASVEGTKVLLRFGCRFNSFGIVDGSGCIGQISKALSYEDTQSLFSTVMINFPHKMEIDIDGRTVIHNLVSTKSSNISALQYPELIEQISGTRYDVDDQDKSGKTALHMAAKFHHLDAISGLLMAGADINILNSHCKTPFASTFDSCMKCECDDDSDSDSDDEDIQLCKHQKTAATLANHINKLKIFELYVSKQNEDLAFEVCEREKFESEAALSENFFKELETAKTTRIGSSTLTLRGFLSENGAIAGFPRMLIEKRDAVNNFFSPSEMPACRKKFPELAGILLMQYRKARARPKLVESAQSALTVCVGFRMPEICSDFVLMFLKNSDLKSLIAAAICTEVAE